MVITLPKRREKRERRLMTLPPGRSPPPPPPVPSKGAQDGSWSKDWKTPNDFEADRTELASPTTPTKRQGEPMPPALSSPTKILKASRETTYTVRSGHRLEQADTVAAAAQTNATTSFSSSSWSHESLNHPEWPRRIKVTPRDEEPLQQQQQQQQQPEGAEDEEEEEKSKPSLFSHFTGTLSRGGGSLMRHTRPLPLRAKERSASPEEGMERLDEAAGGGGGGGGVSTRLAPASTQRRSHRKSLSADAGLRLLRPEGGGSADVRLKSSVRYIVSDGEPSSGHGVQLSDRRLYAGGGVVDDPGAALGRERMRVGGGWRRRPCD